MVALWMHLSYLWTQGTCFTKGPGFCMRVFVPVTAPSVFLKGTFSQWLRVPGVLRVTIPGRHGSPLTRTSAWELLNDLRELSLEFHCDLRGCHPAFLLLYFTGSQICISPFQPPWLLAHFLFQMFPPDKFFAYLILPWHLLLRGPWLMQCPTMLWSSTSPLLHLKLYPKYNCFICAGRCWRMLDVV